MSGFFIERCAHGILGWCQQCCELKQLRERVEKLEQELAQTTNAKFARIIERGWK